MTLIKFAAVAALATCSVIEARTAEPAARGQAQPESGRLPQSRSNSLAQALYDSAFADYRAFSADTAPKDWRKANEEVREVGGHAGLMKGAPGQPKGGHAAHGAKQQAPATSGEHK